MIETSVTLASLLNLKVVAEGVETHGDWNLVAEAGCDVAQGFLIAKPMPADSLRAWYGEWLGGAFGRLNRAGPGASDPAH
jgi:EAL domain-containing protein (putative c-di-GMP-specific phosphodiesterase class I)